MAFEEPGNWTSISDMLTYTNEVTEFSFGTGILITAWFIAIMTITRKTTDFGNAFTASSFICSVLALMMRGLGLVSDLIMFGFIFMTIGGFLYVWFRN